MGTSNSFYVIGPSYCMLRKLIFEPQFKDFICTVSQCMHAKSSQLCPTFCDTMDSSPPGFLSMGFSRQENWSRLSCFPLGDLPNSGMESMPILSPALADGFFSPSATCKPEDGPNQTKLSSASK